MEKNML